MFKFQVDRKTWVRGGKNGDTGIVAPSGLLNSADCRCCLGFLASACGGDDVTIRHMRRPDDVPQINWPEGLVVTREFGNGSSYSANSEACRGLMDVNDDFALTEEEREGKLKTMFAKLNVEVEFVG